MQIKEPDFAQVLDDSTIVLATNSNANRKNILQDVSTSRYQTKRYAYYGKMVYH